MKEGIALLMMFIEVMRRVPVFSQKFILLSFVLHPILRHGRSPDPEHLLGQYMKLLQPLDLLAEFPMGGVLLSLDFDEGG